MRALMYYIRRFILLGLWLGPLAFTTDLLANPAGGSLAAGAASIAGEGTSAVTINQTSDRAIINWQSFSIDSGEITKFVQPSSTSAVLNRVLGGEESVINGTLNANGQVYLINGNGIVVGPGGVIGANAFTASTRDISDSDFLAGNLHFTGSNTAGVQNLGAISGLGGDVVLIGKTVDNQGTMNAPNGTAGLVAGDDVWLSQKNADGSTITVIPTTTATSASGQVGVHNSGSITAAAAELKAANGNIYALAIQNEGTIRATTVLKQGGHIWLTSDAGTISNSGTLDASATGVGGQGGTVTLKSTTGLVSHTGAIIAKGGTGGNGGKAEISGAGVQFSGSVDLTAVGGALGTLLLDPLTLTVQTGGSTNLNSSVVDPNAVESALATANVTLDADAAITIESGLSWSSAGTLTLQSNLSGSAISINAGIAEPKGGLIIDAAGATDSITANGAVDVAKFVLRNGSWTQDTVILPAFTASNNFEIHGGTFLRSAGGDGSSGNPYQITDVYGLQGIGSPSNSLLGTATTPIYYLQTQNIDARSTSTWNPSGSPVVDAGFSPIGSNNHSFYGTYNGGGYTISGLTINRPNQNDVGLFARTGKGSTLQNIGLVGGAVTGSFYVGSLVGFTDGTLEASYTNCKVNGQGILGGLAGYSDYDSIVEACYATGSVTGSSSVEVGGLVGFNYGLVETSYATGAVNGGPGSRSVGGLLGGNSGTVTMSYATGTVRGSENVGGLVGYGDTGSLEMCYATGAVTAGANSLQVGGLVGYNADALVESSYSTGAVTAGANSSQVGGLVGDNETGTAQPIYPATVETSYATGTVTAGANSQYIGGLVGYNSGTITSCFWDIITSGISSLTGGVGGGANSGVTGETTASLLQTSTYTNAGWDFTLGTGVWGINGYTSTGLVNNGLPYFQWQYPTQALVTPTSQTLTYNGTTGNLNQGAYTTTFAPVTPVWLRYSSAAQPFPWSVPTSM